MTVAPSGWPVYKVEDVAAATSNALATGPFGSSISAKFFTEVGVPVIRGSNLNEDVGERLNHDKLVFVSEEKAAEFSRSTVIAGDLIFTCWGTIGQVGLIDERAAYDRYVVSNKQMKLTPDPEKADSLFLYYSFSSPSIKHAIQSQAIGSSVPGFNLTQLKSIELALPPIDEQRRIAAVLGALDDKIELNRKMNRTLEEMAQALFKSWFIDFDGHEDLVDSELGPIPIGSAVRVIGDFIRVRRGLSYKGAHLADHGTPMVNLKCIAPGGGFRHERLKHYNGEFKERHVVRPGELVIANTDLTQAREVLGCPAIVPRHLSAPSIASHHIYITEPTGEPPLPNAFLYYLLKSPQLRDRCQGFASGTTVLAITPDVIEHAAFVLPPMEKVQAFGNIADTLHRRMELNLEESRTLAALRDLLLPKLISGELRVPESLPLP